MWKLYVNNNERYHLFEKILKTPSKTRERIVQEFEGFNTRGILEKVRGFLTQVFSALLQLIK